jgi:hypothetical protein
MKMPGCGPGMKIAELDCRRNHPVRMNRAWADNLLITQPGDNPA